MAKFKPYDYSQAVMVTVFLEEQLMPRTLEFAIHTLIDTRVDMSIFDDRYCNDETGCRAYDPKILLKIVLLAYSRGLFHSRKIEKACRENITFMVMSCCQIIVGDEKLPQFQGKESTPRSGIINGPNEFTSYF